MRLAICLLMLTACGFGDNLAAHGGGTTHFCGDQILDPGEGCDDGNNVGGDGCSATCTVETSTPACGNGVVETGEACDDGNLTAGDGCSPTCAHESVCGNGTVDAGETCDDGNTTPGDGCSSTCQTEPISACALVPQAGCTAPTPACDLTAADDGTTGCRAVTKQGTSNDHCLLATDCKAGFTCVHDATETTTTCSRFCVQDSGCTGTGSRCVIALTGDIGQPLNLDVCSNACDVFAQTGCPSGMGCIGVDATAGDFTDCVVMAGTADGDPCTHIGDCLAGSTCVTDGVTASCRPYCLVGDDTTCTLGTCGGFTSPLVIGAEELGACQ